MRATLNRFLCASLPCVLTLALGPRVSAADRPIYPTSEACIAAVHAPCEEVEGGWSPVYISDPGNTTGSKDVVDQENLDRQRMSMQTNVSGTSENPVVAVDMNRVTFPDVQPYLDSSIGRVRVPVRFVSEQMGATVTWTQETQVVTITRGSQVISLRVDDPNVIVNGQLVVIDAPPKLVDPGRVMVPLRFLSEVFGAAVDWVGEEPPAPGLTSWGHFQVWVWVDWGYWGKYTLQDRLATQHDWFYRGPGR